MKFKNSYEVIEKIEMKKRNGIALRQFKAYMDFIGNPEKQLRCIHIGGTNGKGSTSNNVAEILMQAGYKVGLFTSPYLEVHHDRIRVNGEYIPDEVIVNYANASYDIWVDYDLSMFEIDMYIATQYFVDCGVDFAVFEVGMGGDRDATNIITPLVSAITNIGMDHTEFLGDTLLEIAEKKAGIIKADTALITGVQQEACLTYFQKVCKEKNVEMIRVAETKHVHTDTCLHYDYKNYKDIKQPTLALYQAKNGSLAIEIIDYLRTKGFVEVSDEQLYAGLSNAMWKGRFELLCENPYIIVDGAHNNEGMDALVESATQMEDLQILFTALKDKPHHTMLEKLCSISDNVVVCEFSFPRADTAENIARGFDVEVIPDYKEAIETMVARKKPLLICGSLYFISLVREYVKKKV